MLYHLFVKDRLPFARDEKGGFCWLFDECSHTFAQAGCDIECNFYLIHLALCLVYVCFPFESFPFASIVTTVEIDCWNCEWVESIDFY